AVRPSAEPRRHVERRTAETSVREPDGLARVDSDADLDREAGVRFGRRLELALEVDGRANRLTSGLEDRERLVAADLDELAAVRLDLLFDEAREPRSQLRSRLVAVLLGEAGVAAHVGD